jgi:hypothetical protein
VATPCTARPWRSTMKKARLAGIAAGLAAVLAAVAGYVHV